MYEKEEESHNSSHKGEGNSSSHRKGEVVEEEEVAERSRAITTPIITTMATAILAAASIIAAAAAIPNRRSLYLRPPLSRSRSKVVGKVQASRLRLRRRSRQALQVVRRIRITSITGRAAASRMLEQAPRRMRRILVRVQAGAATPAEEGRRMRKVEKDLEDRLAAAGIGGTSEAAVMVS